MLLTISPLCVEEMDISDKNFRPCPCGYQICQFCYNNIRQNPELNGRCPGCRRLYDDESVEYKTLTAEEYKMQQLKREKREREKKQKEKEKKELEIASKKHLAGLRVVQKNLVYVTGLSPPCAPEDLHSVLRSDKYFGQYGKITKIVINKKTPGGGSNVPVTSGNQSIVVYVTFAKKEDASRCIAELDGSLCDGRVLRAAHGTTKYCLSYLRGHPCANPNCMFLHEPGEEADLYTRKDLLTQQGIKMGMSGSRGGQHHLVDEDTQLESEDHQQALQSSSNHPAAFQSTTPNIAHAVASSTGVVPSTGLPSAGATLPATAHWAKALESAQASPLVNNNAPMTNTAAFPSLGEIFKEQKQKKDVKQKSKGKSNKDGQLLPDDVDIDDNSAVLFAEDTAERLKHLAATRQQLKVHFDDLTLKEDLLPLFHYNESYGNNSCTPEEEKVFSRLIIEQFLLRPIKKYHLAYQNHPISQQQQFLHQEAQLQQQAQAAQLAQTPNLNSSRLQQLDQHLQQQQPQGQNTQPQLQAQPLGQPQMSDPALQQQQQLLLLQQLQQQAVQQGKQQQTPSQLSAQLNQLRMSERSKTATPPPPGLFGKATPDNAQQPPAPANQSSSSQLLTQLMSGKK